MYKISIGGVVKEVSAAAMTVESGTIIFFEDETHKTSRLIVASGKWDYIEVGEDSPVMCVGPRTPAPVPEEFDAELGLPEDGA